ncbi:MAG: radical SAM domain-containing protein [Deltaproteobacteria bacterium]|nr:radical SAM domain-containing protein [Deltaproteobacteria bacterium]
MATKKPDALEIFPFLKGADQYSKVSYPLRYGHYSEIRTAEYIYQFNLNGEIKFISGKTCKWPDPSEWLKRTVTNDWLYYSTGGYSGTKEYSGEYYVPCARYSTNSILINSPFDNVIILSAIKSYDTLYEKIRGVDAGGYNSDTRLLIEKIRLWSPENLKKRSSDLRDILGDRITVLPPDARHADYDVIPIVIADGCLYKCGFCALKSPKRFSLRSEKNIRDQVHKLSEFYGEDIRNYNSIFLAQHDALNAGIDLIEQTAQYAFNLPGIKDSCMKGKNLFLFGSVGSLLKADDEFIKKIEHLPCKTYINIGLESADEETLRYIKKDITAHDVERAFCRIMEINRKYEHIELTTNFLFSERLPENHLPSIFKLVDKHITGTQWKGSVYFSPMLGGDKEEIRGTKRKFYDIKRRLRAPCFLYLIQRL